MSQLDVRVVKVGGSLLSYAPLATKLAAWLAEQSAAHHVLLAGGGELADTIREADRRLHLGDENSHWMCIDAMIITARMLAHLLPEATITTNWVELRERSTGTGITVLDAAAFLRTVEPTLPGTTLPRSWAVTSDSIAGRLAVVLQAQELVLLKSTLPPRDAASSSRSEVELARLAECGFVDLFFPQLASELPPTRIVDLRSGGEVDLHDRLPMGRVP